MLSRVKDSDQFIESTGGAFCLYGVLSADIDYLTKTITLANYSMLESIEIGSAALIDNEIVRVDSINTTNGTVTLGRGCVDTVPTPHSAGALVWFYDGFELTDAIEYDTGLMVEAKLVSHTLTEQLDSSKAHLDTITM